jgi:hypothetical protein
MRIVAPGAIVETGKHRRTLRKTWRDGDRIEIDFRPEIRSERLPDETIAIYRGALLFVQPWPSRLAPLPRREFRVAGFREYEVKPAWPRYDLPPWFIDPRLKNFGFRVVRPAAGDPLHPWDKPPVILRGEFRSASWKDRHRKSGRLVPVGCTLLRFASFRVWPFDEAYFPPPP